MFIKIIVTNIWILFAIKSLGFSAESGGMPQLDPEFWFSQIFWLVISFGILIIVLSKFILPNISSNLESRKSQILENIEKAEKQRNDSEAKIKEYEKIIFDSRSKAKNIISEAKKNVILEINKKRDLLDAELNNEINIVEKEIIDLMKKSPIKINQIAVDTSSDIIKQLIGADVNKSNISAIVEEISKIREEQI